MREDGCLVVLSFIICKKNLWILPSAIKSDWASNWSMPIQSWSMIGCYAEAADAHNKLKVQPGDLIPMSSHDDMQFLAK
jgi:hypothetical protein